MATGTMGPAPAARLRPSCRLLAIKDGVGVAMLPLPMARKVGNAAARTRAEHTQMPARFGFFQRVGV